jgi:phenylalanyl-tRNA synthetase alpha chain
MSLFNQIDDLKRQVEHFTDSAPKAIEEMRIALLGKKGAITKLFEEFRNVPAESKKEFGQALNELKSLANERLADLKSKAQHGSDEQPETDMSAPMLTEPVGSEHPISIVRSRIIEIFGQIGYAVSEGPEVEDDHHNFSALNFPPDHPARDMQDTFFVQHGTDLALRTHTSSVQVRVMENSKPPIRTISPGRVYRNEAISARAHCMFHQVEGLYIDRNVSFADLKGTLDHFSKAMFGPKSVIRLRPSYFPFTEPSAEVDIPCTICHGDGCGVCKYSGWVEIMGCGMVDPNVLNNCGIDPEEYSGFAFGMGVERIAQLLYRVPDLRMYWENDLRFLKQFTGAFGQ